MTFDKSFKKALNFTLKWEGGYVNHPADRGGACNMGITQGALLSAQRRGVVDRTVTIKSLTRADAAKIYRRNYWEAGRCNELPAPLCLAHFDACVNNGIGNASRFLQKVLNLHNAGLVVDGVIGQKTMTAIKNCDVAAHRLASEYNEQRERKFRGIVAACPSQKVFLNGWLNRLSALRKECEA